MNVSIYLIIAFILFLAIVIVSGRILNEINLTSSSCRSDSHIQSAHKWAAWTVGISATGAGLALLALIVIIAIKVLPYVMEAAA